MIITSLVENTSCRPDVGQEHGLSLFIQSGGHTILFDFGQSELFCENASALGADLASVQFGVLSHGHYDHGGGLRRFLQVNSNANVYVSRAAFEKHYNAKNASALERRDGSSVPAWPHPVGLRPHISYFSYCSSQSTFVERGDGSSVPVSL